MTANLLAAAEADQDDGPAPPPVAYPDHTDLSVFDRAGARPPVRTPADWEVRAIFSNQHKALVEDPITGSLNASLAQWLLRTNQLTAPYTSSQGTALGRAGRVHITQDPDHTIWIGGGTVTCITGSVEL